jgi:hypothetical protein
MGSHRSYSADIFARFAMGRSSDVGAEQTDTTALLRCLGDVAGERALILGGDVDIMCAMIRRGCAEVTEFDSNHRPEADSADLIIVPKVRSEDDAARAVSHACRALVPTGRIAVRAAANPSDHLTRSVVRALHLHGFCRIDTSSLDVGTVVTAERPMFSAWHPGAKHPHAEDGRSPAPLKPAWIKESVA